MPSSDKTFIAFRPEEKRLRYPDIAPGIYLYLTHKLSRHVFLRNNNSGCGHPFYASLINTQLGLPKEDYSWIGEAGEMVFGHELLGFSCLTGYFHKLLLLTEPQKDRPDFEREMASYIEKIKLRLEASFLPPERYFPIEEWQTIFQRELRDLLFTATGFFQKISAKQLSQQLEQVQLSFPSALPENAQILKQGLLQTMMALSEPEPSQLVSKNDEKEENNQNNFNYSKAPLYSSLGLSAGGLFNTSLSVQEDIKTAVPSPKKTW